jgi:polar amino acid transport system substrate-binding protein
MNKEIETVKLVADPYPPYQYEQNDTVKGIDHDIITAAFKEYHIETKTRLFPWEVCIEQMESAKADGIFQITPTPERKKAYLFSHPIRTARAVFFRKAQISIGFNKDEDILTQLKRYKLGVLAGYSYDPMIDSLREPVKTEVKSQEQLLEDLLDREFDLAMMDLGVASYLIEKMHIDGIEQVQGYQIARQLHVAFQKDLGEFVHLFNVGLQKIKEKGLYNKIFEDHGYCRGE